MIRTDFQKIPSKRFLAPILFVLSLLLCLGGCTASPGGPGESVSAAQLLYGILTCGSFDSPDLLFCYGDGDFAERFESILHTEMPDIADAAIAISSEICADEITVIRPDGNGDEIEAMLEAHVNEQIAVYERYSPTDAANLRNAWIGREGGFVILIVSDRRDEIRDRLRSYLQSPDTLPSLPGSESTSTTTHTDPTTSDSTTAPRDGSTGQTIPPATTSIPTTTGDPETTQKPETTTRPETTPPPVTNGSSGFYVYDNALPERDPVSDDFFTDAVFIGDSRLAGIMLYVHPTVAADYTVESINVNSVFTSKVIAAESGEKLTIADALPKTEFNKCYLMFGVNELGWPSSDAFIRSYVKVIELVRSVNPDAEIYILNVFPMTKTYSDKHSDLGNTVVQALNEKIAKMAKEQDVYLVNAAAALSDEDGNLPASASGDGVHGNRATCRKLYEYMCTHY